MHRAYATWLAMRFSLLTLGAAGLTAWAASGAIAEGIPASATIVVSGGETCVAGLTPGTEDCSPTTEATVTIQNGEVRLYGIPYPLQGSRDITNDPSMASSTFSVGDSQFRVTSARTEGRVEGNSVHLLLNFHQTMTSSDVSGTNDIRTEATFSFPASKQCAASYTSHQISTVSGSDSSTIVTQLRNPRCRVTASQPSEGEGWLTAAKAAAQYCSYGDQMKAADALGNAALAFGRAGDMARRDAAVQAANEITREGGTADQCKRSATLAKPAKGTAGAGGNATPSEICLKGLADMRSFAARGEDVGSMRVQLAAVGCKDPDAKGPPSIDDCLTAERQWREENLGKNEIVKRKEKAGCKR